ncbi:hypothetical protein [Streptococcus sp. NLN76]|uniref:hypothetical protein n=1 Tax=Streptococcus sp. NLN76 TaxID=2822800 RepID=UPI001FFC7EE1|nr:hypothetical protein [Streptococcus sp. NLN76]
MKIGSKKQFIPLSNEQLMLVTGSWSGWGVALQGLLGGLAPSPTLDQLYSFSLSFITVLARLAVLQYCLRLAALY